MVDPVCPACAGPLSPWQPVLSAEPALGDRTFQLWRCAACASAVTTGGVDELGELHDAGAYRPGTPRLHRLALPLLRRFDARRLALLGRLAEPGSRVLDAGAGQGRFVAAARAAGYEATGLEPSRRGRERAAALGVELVAGSIEVAGVEAGSVDAAVLWHVLEHLERPDLALSRIAGWLAPGGGLLVGVPNLASWQARIGGARWFHLDVPRHRVHFTAHGVTALLTRCGFEVLAVEHRLLEHNPFGMWQSLVNRWTRHPSYLYNLLKRNAPLASNDLAITAAALPLVPLAAALEAVAGLRRRGGTIAVLARRVG